MMKIQITLQSKRNLKQKVSNVQNLSFGTNANGKQVPVTKDDHGTCMVSGCSPAILTAILSGKEIDPIQVMLDAIDIDRYDSVVA